MSFAESANGEARRGDADRRLRRAAAGFAMT